MGGWVGVGGRLASPRRNGIARNCKRTNIYVCLICLFDADDNRCMCTNRGSDLYKLYK